MKHKHITYPHLMVDLETMGNSNNSCILLIAAVEFNMDGDTGASFCQGIDLQSCLDAGLQVDGSTVMWWMKQSSEARESLTSYGSIELAEALLKLGNFMFDSRYSVWGNSARFDLGILDNAFKKCELSIPWDFRKERDVRTLVSFNPDLKSSIPFEGVRHDPLADCYHQIRYCTAIWRSLFCSGLEKA